MTIEEISRALRSNIEKVVRVIPVSGDPELLLVVSVDEEGFTYHPRKAGQDPKVTHWWPKDEIAEVEGPIEDSEPESI